MNNQKLLTLINTAIGNLGKDENGLEAIEYMRKHGIKSSSDKRMFIFPDSVGACLEEIRCMILDDEVATASKKSGKSSVLSAVKKLSKEAYKKSKDLKPALAYAWYDETGKKYFLTNGYWLLVSENADGLELAPESVKDVCNAPINYKRYIPEISKADTVQLPPLEKLSAYLKQAKAKSGKRDKSWCRIVFPNKLVINGEFLESFMKITGATELKNSGFGKAVYMEGNGYQGVIMPCRFSDNDIITDFNSI